MMYITKKLFVALLAVVFLSISLSPVYADVDKMQIESIKQAVEKEFEYHKPALELDKKHFGLTASESYANATLGDGMPYYVVSDNYLKEGNNPESILSLRGYVFPIKVGNKPAGIVLARYLASGELGLEMTSNNTFEQDITDAQKKVPEGLAQKAVYVFDDYYRLYGLAIPKKDGYDFLPIWENPYFGLQKHQLKSFDEFREKMTKLKQFRKENPMILGGFPDDSYIPSEQNSKNSLYLTIAFVVFVFGTVLIIKRTRHAKKV